MSPHSHLIIHVDYSRIRVNAERIAQESGVPLIAVVKANAYGLGASRVAAAIGDLVRGFYVFDAEEAVRYNLHTITGKESIAMLGASNDAADYVSHHIRPAVWTLERAALLRDARPVLSVDSGQRRFGCPLSDAADILRRAGITEALTHAVTVEQARAFDAATTSAEVFRHAAGTVLIGQTECRFDAVRPGLGLYVGATRVSARLIEVHSGAGPAGYTGFVTPNHGVIRGGYSNGLRPGVCRVNGGRRRVIEVGMQSAFVELDAADRVGDEVVLLGDDLTEAEVAAAWRCTPQEVLARLIKA